MASIGPLYPESALTNVGPSGDNDWISVSPIQADDGSEAQITAATFDAGDQSYALIGYYISGFDAIGDTDTINGVLVEIDRRCFAGAASDAEVRLTDTGGYTATFSANKASASAWPATLTVASYGGASDTWSAALTPAVVKSTGFGAILIVNADAANTDIGVDFIRVTVYYTAANTVPGSFTADATIKKLDTPGSVTADAVIRKLGIAGSVTADASIKKLDIPGSVTADATINKTTQGSVSADATIKRLGLPGSVTADAVVRKLDIGGSFTADAQIAAGTGIGTPTWVSPPNTDTMGASPTLVFTIPTGPAGNYHFHLQLDTADTFNTGNLRELRTNVSTTGWEYWNGSSWQPFPTTGVPSTYAGNEARYTVQTPLTTGTWYRRIRAGG